MTKDEFKQTVKRVLENKGCTKVKVDMSIFGMQGEAQYREEGSIFKREAHVWLKEKDGVQFLKFEQKNGFEWTEEI